MTPKGKTDLLTQLAEFIGLRVAKGSFEGGGRHALVTILDQVKTGHSVAVPASGPYSPEHSCKSGCFIIAGETHAPIIPISWKARFQTRWPWGSQILLPLPFNAIEIRLGEAFIINKHYEHAELEGAKTQLSMHLDRLSE